MLEAATGTPWKDKATASCKQWLSLKRLAQMLLQQQLSQELEGLFTPKMNIKKTEQRVCLGEELVMLHPGQDVVKQVLLNAEVCSN